MSIVDQLKALPGDAWLGSWDGGEYDPAFRSDDLKALAESHERLLKAAKAGGWCGDFDRYGMNVIELNAAIEQAEKV